MCLLETRNRHRVGAPIDEVPIFLGVVICLLELAPTGTPRLITLAH